MIVTIIRCSTLPNWPDCPRRGATRLIPHEIAAAGHRLRHLARGIGGIVGTAVHRAAAVSLGEKAKTGHLPPASVATDAALDSLSEQLATGEIAYDGPRGATHNRNDAVRQAVGMTKTYDRVIAPEVEPIIVEERYLAEVSPGLILSGQPDLICREPNKVRDLKTGARPPGSHAAQVGGYSLLARSNGIDIAEAAIDFIQRVAVGKPQPDPVSKAVAIAQAETAASSILKHIESDLATFRHGDPVRRILPGDPWAFVANPASILCSPKYCSAFGTSFCHEGDPAKELQ